jgi:hypothetical protein
MVLALQLQFWALYRSDDGLADGPKVATREKCCCLQDCILNIFIYCKKYLCYNHFNDCKMPSC